MHLGFFSSLFLSLLLKGLINFNLSIRELLFNFFVGSSVALKPFVCKKLLDIWSVVGVELHARLHDLLELFGEEVLAFFLALAMGSPENVSSTCSHASVKGVLWLGGGEWRVSGDHDEENGSGSKQVDRSSLVWCFQVLLRRHVVESAKSGVQITLSIFTFNWCGETKVRNFEIVVTIQ